MSAVGGGARATSVELEERQATVGLAAREAEGAMVVAEVLVAREAQGETGAMD